MTPTNGYERLLGNLLKEFVDHPNELRLLPDRTQTGDTTIQIVVAPQDFGRVCGKQGRTFKALETLIACRSALLNERVTLRLNEPARRATAPQRPDVPNSRWTKEDDKVLANLLHYVFTECFREQPDINIDHTPAETFLQIESNHANIIPEAFDALHTIFRTIGGVKRRKITVRGVGVT